MPPIALPMHAVLFPHEDMYVPAREIARRLESAFPGVQVDWARGERWVEAKVRELTVLGAPDVILQSARSYHGHVVHVSLSLPEWRGVTLSSDVNTLNRDLGDSLAFEIEPFDIRCLVQGATALSSALGFDFRLEYDQSFEVCACPAACSDPIAAARLHKPVPLGDDPTISVVPLEDWRRSTRSAVLKWLAASSDKNKFNAHTRAFGTLEDYARAVVDELAAIADVRQAWSVDVEGWSHQNDILLDQGAWTTIINLSGVPKGIVA